MTVSQNPHQPAPAEPRQPDPAPRPERGWRWWFVALGPWVGVAIAIIAIILGR